MSPTADHPRIVVPLYEGFNLLDLCGPAEMFSWAGYEVALVAEVPGEVTAVNGFILKVENTLPDPAERCDALWVPGGDPASSTASSPIPGRATSSSCRPNPR
jgi:putative intracellular protease/amidase